MRIMAVGPHPDDMENLCAGTLAKYKDAGHDIAMVCVTNGEVGSQTLSPAEIAAVRRQEAEKAAAIIDAKFFWMGYPDEFLFNTPEVRLHMIDVVRQFAPDVVITTDREHDYHPDHTTVGQLVWDIHVMPAVVNIETRTKATTKIPSLYYMDTLAGINFRPEVYVDITDQWHTKEAMLACHESQMQFCHDLYGASLIENSKVQARFRGYQSSCLYAEAFRRVSFYPQKADSWELLSQATDRQEGRLGQLS